MEKKYLKALVFVTAAVFTVIGCAAQEPAMKQKTEPAFKPIDLNAGIKGGQYVQKVQTFMVLLDASGTMAEPRSKFELAKDLISRMNQTIPDLRLAAGLRTFGQGFTDSTDLVYGMADYSKASLAAALGRVDPGGFTPMGHAIEAAIGDLKPTRGNIAVIIVSDGLETDRGALAAAGKMKGQFGERVCIYTVLVGNDPAGKRIMEQVAEAGKCGFSVNAAGILSNSDIAGFVEKVFLTRVAKPMDSDGDGVTDDLDQCPNTPRGVKVDDKGCPLDSDGDGVPDYLDRCPNTPRGVKVDEKGCPLDGDGDGVPDYLDQCPRTPKGARVNEVGCWVITDADMRNVEFDLNKWNIKPQFYSALNHVVAILNENPRLKVEIQGHTDSSGTETYNQGLSEKRAASVLNYFVMKGIAKERLAAAGYGELRPVATNATSEGRAKNRRVQLSPIY
jgi:OOP family OmpA-OmpF porin